ncbi:constitutive coactivator of peroxisome proliferator-activated receptor gamma isoform X19 [Macaca fascicularis]
MSSGEIECSNTLEDELDQALPSQAFIYRPIRQRVYSLLLEDCQDVASTCPAVKEWFVYPGNPLRHPDLVRPLQMSVPGGTPSLKILWLNQEPEMQVRRLDTLLACFNLSSSREELQAVESPFQALCCLLIYLFVQVDTLCLEDLHAFIAQALCLQGKSTSQLVNLQRSRLTKFHNLKAVVCKACMKENRRITGRAHWGSHHAGRWGRQGSGYHRTGSGYSRSSQGQPWRDQGPGSRQYEHDQWRRY